MTGEYGERTIILEVTPGEDDPRVLVDGKDVTRRCRKITLTAGVAQLELFRKVGDRLVLVGGAPAVDTVEGRVGYAVKHKPITGECAKCGTPLLTAAVVRNGNHFCADCGLEKPNG
jgi:hypothetical protein